MICPGCKQPFIETAQEIQRVMTTGKCNIDEDGTQSG